MRRRKQTKQITETFAIAAQNAAQTDLDKAKTEFQGLFCDVDQWKVVYPPEAGENNLFKYHI